MTRIGKIARLPREVRDELNRRLQEGEPGKQLVAWLNGLPETKRVMAEYFEGCAINEPNLSGWKAGGFQDWLARENALEQAQELSVHGAELKGVTKGALTEHLATVLAMRYASTLSKWNGEVTEEFRLKVRGLRMMCQNIVALRQGDLKNARLTLEVQGARSAVRGVRSDVAGMLDALMRDAECGESNSRIEDGGLKMAGKKAETSSSEVGSATGSVRANQGGIKVN